MPWSHSRISVRIIILLCSFRRTIALGSPRPMDYLVSGFWPPKQCQVWLLAHGVGLTPNQTEAAYSQCCALLHQRHSGWSPSQMGGWQLGWCLPFSSSCSQSSLQSHVDKSAGVKASYAPAQLAAFSNGAWPSVCGEQWIAWTTFWGVRGFQGTLWSTAQWDVTIAGPGCFTSWWRASSWGFDSWIIQWL